MANRVLRVFLCHSSQDKPSVRQLYHQLKTENIAPWLDEEDLVPGQNWDVEIRKAVRLCDIVIVCLSKHSINKVGYVQREIKFALDVADEQPEGTIFLIPLRLEECEIPDRLRHLHWVNYFEEGGFLKLMQALKMRAQSLEEVAPIDSSSDHKGLVFPQVQNSVSSDQRGQLEQALPFLNEDTVSESASDPEAIEQANESQDPSSSTSVELMLPISPTSKTATDSSKTLANKFEHPVTTNLTQPPPIAVFPTATVTPSSPVPPISFPRTPQSVFSSSESSINSQVPKTRKIILFVALILLIVGSGVCFSLSMINGLVKFSPFVTTPNLASQLISATADAYATGTTKSGVMFGFDPAHTHWNPYEKVLNTTNISHLKLNWSYATSGAIESSPAVANGIVYVGSNDGKLYAFDASCHSACQPLWSYPTGDRISSSPAIANRLVYIGSEDGNFYAFDASCRSSCQPLWSYPTGSSMNSSPAVANGVIYVSSDKLYAFDASCRHACQPLWYATGHYISSPSSPAVANGVIYVGSWDDHKLYAFDTNCHSDCQPLWSYPAGWSISSSPTVANGIVYVGSEDSRVYAFDASCRSGCLPLWSYPTGLGIYSSPAVANGVVYVGSEDHKLYAFDTSCHRACQPLWSYTTGSNINSSPAVANGVVYVGSGDGKLYAFGIT